MHVFDDDLWMFDPEDEALVALDPRWPLRREIAADLRKLNLLALTRDLDADALNRLRNELASTVAWFDGSRQLAGRTAHSEHMDLSGPANRLALEMSPAIGRSNAMSISVALEVRDGRLSATAAPQWVHEGPAGWMHGGLIAMLLDEFLGLAQGELGPNPGNTGTLSIRYVAPTPLDVPLRLIARSARQEGRKRFLTGEIWANDVQTATAEAIFIIPRGADDAPP